MQKPFTGASYLDANPAYRGNRDPIPFGVVREQVRRLGSGSAGVSPVPEVPARWNGQVVKAALATAGDTTLVAVVRRDTGGRAVLDVGAGVGRVDALQRIDDLRADSMSQPVWLPGDADTGLVVTGGRLRAFRSSAGPVRPVANAPSGITAFAVPPDARRLAYVLNGRLHVAPLLRVAGALSLGDPQPIPTTLTELTAVGWSQQDWLVIAGRRADGLVALHDITVDGAAQATPRGGQFGTQPVEHLVASTDDPVDGRGAGQVMYMANGLTFEVFRQQRLLKADDVAGATSSPGAGETATAGGPTSPFFLD
jgi:hypothetical protein